ncbi:hypothetical protein BDV93DRAFT_611308 [Ceratobasidium sp. AG-I]|nr:hypothetical protein BDV93DRAFT_611308 [Ceratobasidium sp. AG-I]
MVSHDTLPSEILDCILCFLTTQDLASTSLVSRVWRNLSFPRLYHTVYLSYASHLEQLSNLISSEHEGNSTPPVSAYLRELVFDEEHKKREEHEGSEENEEDEEDEEDDTDCWIGEEHMSCLAAILPRLCQLEHFSWDMCFIPRDPSVLSALQSKCPNLKSVYFTINEDEGSFDYYDGEYTQLFNFTDLSHFSLTIYNMPGEYDEDHVGPLVSLLQASPRLQSLSLEFHDHYGGKYRWSPDTIFSSLGIDAVYPSLHTLRLLGAFDPNWSSFCDKEEPDPLWKFVSRHPALRTVGFGWFLELDDPNPIEPTHMVEVFPCLEHLIAPAFICEPVIASELAGALQSLTIYDEFYDEIGPNLETMATAARPMPKLKRLIFHAEREDSFSAGMLKILLGTTPFLVDLELNTSLDQPEEAHNLLKLVPNLSVASSALLLEEA